MVAHARPPVARKSTCSRRHFDMAGNAGDPSARHREAPPRRPPWREMGRQTASFRFQAAGPAWLNEDLSQSGPLRLADDALQPGSPRVDLTLTPGARVPTESAQRSPGRPWSVRLNNGTTFSATPGQSLLDAALSQQVPLEHSCGSARCGSCRVHVTRGQTRALPQEPAEAAAEARRGWVLACAHEALSDVDLDVDLPGGPPRAIPRTVPCRIDTLERLTADVLRVRLRTPPSQRLAWQAGQAVDVMVPGGVRRRYSLANEDVDDDRIELHVGRVAGGVMSRYWFEQARPGDLLRLHGPSGSATLHDVAGLQVVLLATGTGIAPMCALLGTWRRLPAAAQPRRLRLYWGARTPAGHYLQPQGTGANWSYRPVVSGPAPAWQGARGHVQDVLLADGFDPAATIVYACGSAAMVEGARALLGAHGLDPRRFHSDAFVAST
jgi:CDP-4-dehydro-6-deoxyglucose reductase